MMHRATQRRARTIGALEPLRCFAEFVESGAGCSVALRHDGVVDDWQFGLADIGSGAPLTADTIFDIGSVSKQITGGAIAAMSIDGSLSLDTPVTEFFDRLSDRSDRITVSDLVRHVSGPPCAHQRADL
jgi:CubicO group peptidase (beta-lactamase class C family)